MADTDHWLVSTRGDGEVLTTRASVPGLELRLLGGVEGFEADELERWLESVARAVAESVAETPPGDPVPPLLREALSALLFSRAELWNRGVPPCGVALVSGEGRIGLGWVGDASVDLHHEGGDDAEWVSIRDGAGREARAWCGSPNQDVRAELSWSPAGSTARMLVDARWSHAAAAPAPDLAAEAAPETAAVGSSAPEFVVADEPADASAPSAGVARWLEQHVRWNRGEPEGGAEPVVSSSPAAAAEGQAPPHSGVDDIVSALAAEISQHLEAEARTRPVEPASWESATAAEIVEPAEARTAMAPVEAPPLESPPLEIAPPEVEVARVEPVTPESEPPPATAKGPPAEAPRPRRARRPDWPAENDVDDAPAKRTDWRPYAIWGLVVLALFGIGWIVGQTQGGSGPAEARRPSALVLFLRGIGLAPARYEVAVTSRPPGAWIAIDGKDLSIRAPATLELAPGEHKVELSFADLGSASFLVRGAKNDKVPLDVPMWGSLDVVASDARSVVNVTLDGQSLGSVPVHLDSVAPGAHDLRFSAPGMGAWGTTIEVRVGETREVLAYPLQSPATGLLQVRATQSTGGESAALDGARVWVDGAPRGVTPLTLELPRGPHSVRVSHQKEDAPVQVIDLPGGNQRFATFDFGLRSDMPALVLKAPAALTVDEPALISATLSEVGAIDVREMWLHVRTPDNRWRRYPMTLLDAQGSVVGAAPFPIALLDEDGRQLYYVSAVTAQGDEIFTEMQTARGPKPSR